MAIAAPSQPVRVAFIGVGAVTAYHHLPGLRLDPRARLVAICDADPGLLEKRKAEWGVEHATTDADGPVPVGPDRRRGHRHAQRHPPADRRRRGPGRQARHVREAAGPERRRGPRDVRGGPRREGRAHDGVHLPLRPVDALPPAPAQVRGAGHAPALPLAAVPRLARDELGLAAVQGQGRRGRPVRHDDPPHRLRHRPARPDRPGLRGRGPVRPPRPDASTASRARRRRSTTGRA